MSQPDQRHILHLNDDCFYEVYKFLPINDWCSLHETCTRFRTISDYCFDRQSETFCLKPNTVSGEPFDLLKLKDVKRLIRIFGQFITKLSIKRSNFSQQEDPTKMLPLLDRYCLALRDLKLVNIDLVPATIAQCNRLFSNLHRLVIDQCVDEEAFDCCLAHCSALKELELIRFNNIEGQCLANLRFEFLESLSMKSCRDINYGFLKQFFVNNPKIEKLKFLSRYCQADHIMQDVAIALPNLAEFSVQYNFASRPNVFPVQQMSSLKKFEIDFASISNDTVNRLLSGLVVHNVIEDLHLASFQLIDESIRRLCALKTLKVLKLTAVTGLNEKTCKKLATELTALSEIHVIECNNTTFNEIKQFDEHSAHLKRIIFNRKDEAPSLTEDSFLSLVKIRNKKPLSEALFVYLNHDDLVEIKNDFKLNGTSEMLVEHSDQITLRPLEEEHIKTVFDYGSGFRTPMAGRFVFDNMEEEDDFNDMYDDDDDDPFNDDFDDESDYN